MRIVSESYSRAYFLLRRLYLLCAAGTVCILGLLICNDMNALAKASRRCLAMKLWKLSRIHAEAQSSGRRRRHIVFDAPPVLQSALIGSLAARKQAAMLPANTASRDQMTTPKSDVSRLPAASGNTARAR